MEITTLIFLNNLNDVGSLYLMSILQKGCQGPVKVIRKIDDLTLLTDGERRYGNILFEICYELLKTGKRGRPRKTLKKGVKVRVKNKGSQKKKPGRKRKKYQAPQSEHPDTTQNMMVW